MSEPRNVRLFVAIETPADWKAALAEEERRLEEAAPGFARWVHPALMHLTLVFLGGQPPALVPEITAAVERAAADSLPFRLSPACLGSFGGPRSLRVLWAGLESAPPEGLAHCRDAVVQALRDTSAVFEAETFRAHVTLGRARRQVTPAQSQDMHRAVQVAAGQPWSASAAGSPQPFDCSEIVLVRSDLRPTGPIYTPQHRAPFNLAS